MSTGILKECCLKQCHSNGISSCAIKTRRSLTLYQLYKVGNTMAVRVSLGTGLYINFLNYKHLDLVGFLADQMCFLNWVHQSWMKSLLLDQKYQYQIESSDQIVQTLSNIPTLETLLQFD